MGVCAYKNLWFKSYNFCWYANKRILNENELWKQNKTKEVDAINPYIIITAVVAVLLGLLIGYVIRKNISEAKIGQAENLAREILEKANRDSETVKKEKLLEAKEEIHRLRTEGEKENKERRNSWQEDSVFRAEGSKPTEKKWSGCKKRKWSRGNKGPATAEIGKYIRFYNWRSQGNNTF